VKKIQNLISFQAVCIGLVLLSFFASSAHADIIVSWENNSGDLVVRWDGNISNWTRGSVVNPGTRVYFQQDNGLHAFGNGNVDLAFTGSIHNWYTGHSFSNDVLSGDNFGTAGNSNWIYMPYNYAGETISGSVTFAGSGTAVASFVAGSRDLGFGDNDYIVFQAYSVPDTGSTAALLGAGVVTLASARRRLG